MADRLLRKADIAAMLGTSPGVAVSILSRRGCNPIDFGYGRSRGPRWLESAVTAALQAMHLEAQDKHSNPKNRHKTKVPEISLANMRINEVYALLTHKQYVQ